MNGKYELAGIFDTLVVEYADFIKKGKLSEQKEVYIDMVQEQKNEEFKQM